MCVGRKSRERSEREVGRRTTGMSEFSARSAPRSRRRDLTPSGLARSRGSAARLLRGLASLGLAMRRPGLSELGEFAKVERRPRRLSGFEPSRDGPARSRWSLRGLRLVGFKSRNAFTMRVGVLEASLSLGVAHVRRLAEVRRPGFEPEEDGRLPPVGAATSRAQLPVRFRESRQYSHCLPTWQREDRLIYYCVIKSKFTSVKSTKHCVSIFGGCRDHARSIVRQNSRL